MELLTGGKEAAVSQSASVAGYSGMPAMLEIAVISTTMLCTLLQDSMLFMVIPLENFIMIRITCQLHSFVL